MAVVQTLPKMHYLYKVTLLKQLDLMHHQQQRYSVHGIEILQLALLPALHQILLRAVQFRQAQKHLV